MLTHTEITHLASQLATLVVQPQQRWLTLKEACTYAKVKREKLSKWLVDGDIYGVKKDGKWIVDRESIDAFYNSERLQM